MIQRLYRANAIGYAKLFNCTHDAVIRVFERIPLTRQSLAHQPIILPTEYRLVHPVRFVHSVEKSCRKELFIRESGPRRG